MKRFMTLALALVMVLGMFVPSLAPIAKAADEAAAAKYIYKLTPTLDGNLSEWGAPTETVTYDAATHASYPNFGTIDFYWAWDDSYIYFAARVPMAEGTTQAYAQVFKAAGTSYTNDFGYNNFNRAEDSTHNLSEDRVAIQDDENKVCILEGRFAKETYASESVNGYEVVDLVACIQVNSAARVYSSGLVVEGKWSNQFEDHIKVDFYAASIEVTAAEVKKNDTVTATITVGGDAFAASEVIVNYDAAKLEFVQVDIADGENFPGKATAQNGVLKIADAGENKTGYTITFTAIAQGTATIDLTSAKFGTRVGAAGEDLKAANIFNGSATVLINPAEYVVTFPDAWFTGSNAATEGADYVLTPKETANYDYTNVVLTYAVENGASGEVELVDGKYTIPAAAVTGPIAISFKEVTQPPAKSYTVNYTGDAEPGDNDGATATYLTPYVFNVPADVPQVGISNGYTYSATVKIGEEEYTGYTKVGTQYTIPGDAITGDIVINITETTIYANTIVVTIDGTGAGAADKTSGDAEMNVAYVITLPNAETGYDYEVSAVYTGTETKVTVTFNEEFGTYTIAAEDATDNITITITKNLNLDGAGYSVYVANANAEKIIYIVTIGTEKIDGKVYTYGGDSAENKMFWSDKYGTYCYLVFGAPDAETYKNNFNLIDGTADEIAALAVDNSNAATYYNVNGTTTADANDAQFVYNAYNGDYSDFTTATMAKLLCADVVADREVNVQDAQAIVNFLLG